MEGIERDRADPDQTIFTREIVPRHRTSLVVPLLATGILMLQAPRPACAVPPPVNGTLPAEVRDAASAGLFDVVPRPALGVSTNQSDWLVPVIMVGFSDSTLRYAPQDLAFAMFDTTGATATGSVPDYYQWASAGRLRFRGEVVAAVQLPHPENYYTNDSYGLNALSTPNNNWGLVRDAVLAADPQVNWNRYDRDGDGFVDMLWIVHAGLGAELTGSRRNFYSNTARLGYGWSFGGVLETGDIVNGSLSQKMRIDRFSVLPEMSGFHPGTMSEIGVYCHEFGHALGLPDLYDTSSLGGAANVGPGNWSLMSTGAYGGNGHSPEYPSHPGAWPSLYLGWTSAVRPTHDSTVVLTPVADGGSVVEFSCEGLADPEHFLVESREPTGFDRTLPGRGLVLYQVDDAAIGARIAANRVNAGLTPGLRLVEGDGNGDLVAGRNRGDANDVLPGGLGVTRLDDDTVPWLRSISGAVTNLALEDVRLQPVTGASAHFRVRAAGWLDAEPDPHAGFDPVPDPGRSRHAFVTPEGLESEVFADWRFGAPQVLLRTRSFQGDWSAPEVVTSSPTGAIQPTMAPLPGGDLVIAWSDRRTGTYQVWLRTRIAGTWSAERAMTSSTIACTAPALAADARGRVFLSWLEQGTTRATLKFMAFQWASPFGTPRTVTDTLDVPSAPSLASSPDGEAWLMWPDRRSGQYAIMFARFSPDSGLGTKQRYTSNVTLDQASLGLAVEDDGTAHVVWQQSASGVSELHYMTRPVTGSFSPRDTILESSALPLQNPAIAFDPLGGLHVAFERATASGSEACYRRKVPGRGWDFRSTVVSDGFTGSVMRVAVLPVSNGGVSVLYTAFDGSYHEMARRRRADGDAAADVPELAPLPASVLTAGPSPLRPGQSFRVWGLSLAPGERVELFDAAGRRVAETRAEDGSGRATFAGGSTARLSPGLYFVRAGRAATARLVVLR